MTDTPPSDRRPSKATVVAIAMIIMAMGTIVWWNYYLKNIEDLKKARLPMRARVETDLAAWLDQDGKERHLEEVKGKVIVWSYTYTTCPMGCAGLAEEMKKLHEEFGSHPKFQLISVSLYPEHDRPEKLKPWIEAQKFGGPNWWFLTSPGAEEKDGDAVRKWMHKSFGIWAKKKDPAHIAQNPADVWDHQLVMALTDHKGNVRTPTENDSYWWPSHPVADYKWYPRPIREDIIKLLQEAEGE